MRWLKMIFRQFPFHEWKICSLLICIATLHPHHIHSSYGDLPKNSFTFSSYPPSSHHLLLFILGLLIPSMIWACLSDFGNQWNMLQNILNLFNSQGSVLHIVFWRRMSLSELSELICTFLSPPGGGAYWPWSCRQSLKWRKLSSCCSGGKGSSPAALGNTDNPLA